MREVNAFHPGGRILFDLHGSQPCRCPPPIGGEPVKGKVPPQPNDPNWAGLLDAEESLEAQIALADRDARARVASARAAAASALPDPGALATLAMVQEQADIEGLRSELAHIAEEADRTARALTQAPESLIDALAQLALGAVLADKLPAERP
ncbi:MAG TPA: hypothetical protein VF319_10685 [Caldimonas sp.]